MQERIEQMLENELTICVYDTDRNEKAKAHRLEVVSVATFPPINQIGVVVWR
ncbi:MAG: hypothetical protein AAFO91_13960 [Bacteroidota bacterium]